MHIYNTTCIYMHFANNLFLYAVDGMCYDLPKGEHEIKLIANFCENRPTSIHQSGWNYATNVLILEMNSVDPQLATGEQLMSLIVKVNGL